MKKYVVYNSKLDAYLCHSEDLRELTYSRILDDFTVYYNDYKHALVNCSQDEEVCEVL